MPRGSGVPSPGNAERYSERKYEQDSTLIIPRRDGETVERVN